MATENRHTCDHNWEGECLDLRNKCREMEHRIQMLTEEKSEIRILYERLLKEKSELDMKMGRLEGRIEAYQYCMNYRR